MRTKSNLLILFIFILISASPAYGEPPKAPSEVTSSRQGERLLLSWNPPPSEERIEGYHVYRKTRAKKGYRQITDSLQASSFFIDHGLDEKKSYYYAVKAFNKEGESSVYSRRVRIEPEDKRLILPEEIWGKGSRLPSRWGPYEVHGLLRIHEGASLRIEPDTVLLFYPKGGLLVEGRLEALESRFLPFENKASWQGIRLLKRSSPPSRLASCLIKGAKKAISVEGAAPHLNKNRMEENGTALWIGPGSRPIIEENIIRKNRKEGIRLEGDGSLKGNPEVIIRNNSIYDNGEYNLSALHFDAPGKTIIDARKNWWGAKEAEQIQRSLYDFPKNPSSSPIVDVGEFLDSEGGKPSPWKLHYGRITGDHRWSKEDSPYFVVGDLTIERGGRVVIEPGVEVRVSPGSGLFVKGTLQAIGNQGETILFSSFKAPGSSWKGLTLDGGTGERPSLLSYCRIENARRGVTILSGSPRIVYNIVTKNETGFFLQGASKALIESNRIIGNKSKGVHLKGDGFPHKNPTPRLLSNSFENNGPYHIYTEWFGNPGKSVVEARNNLWDRATVEGINHKIYDHNDNEDSPWVDVSGFR